LVKGTQKPPKREYIGKKSPGKAEALEQGITSKELLRKKKKCGRKNDGRET